MKSGFPKKAAATGVFLFVAPVPPAFVEVAFKVLIIDSYQKGSIVASFLF